MQASHHELREKNKSAYWSMKAFRSISTTLWTNSKWPQARYCRPSRLCPCLSSQFYRAASRKRSNRKDWSKPILTKFISQRNLKLETKCKMMTAKFRKYMRSTRRLFLNILSLSTRRMRFLQINRWLTVVLKISLWSQTPKWRAFLTKRRLRARTCKES